MSFDFTEATASIAPLLEEQHLDLAHRAEAFSKREILPLGESDDEADEPARAKHYLEQLRDGGWLEHVVAPDEGGFDLRAICLVRERLAAASAFADVMFVMQGLGTGPVAFGAPPERRKKILTMARSGQPMAFALTEPEAGSDVLGLRSTARREGDDWILDGEKVYISNAGIAAGYSFLARDVEASEAAGKAKLSAFWLPAVTPGLECEAMATMSPHPIGRLRLKGCRVGPEALLGEAGKGIGLALSTLGVFRVSVGAAALGMAQRALDEVARRVLERRQFGRTLADFQLVAAQISDSVAELEAARLLVYRAAADIDGGQAPRHRSSAAKMLATETAFRIVDRSVQLFGGLGVTRGSIAERLYRDVRSLRIYEGTTEIHRLIIAKEWLAARAAPPSDASSST